MSRQPPTEDELFRWMETLRNWGRWGTEDELGTLNYLTPEKRRAAVALARTGETVSCGRPIRYGEPDVTQPVTRYMTATGEGAGAGYGSSSDVFLIAPHGFTKTHLDALCHMFWDGRMYNGRPASAVTVTAGSPYSSIERLGGGILSRGVLLDIPAVRGVDWLQPGEGIFPEDLEAAERRQGVRVESGDVLLVRTGHVHRLSTLGRKPGDHVQFPGLQAACLPWLHARQVALLGCDTANDVNPSGYHRLVFPVHTIGIVFMGLWLIDNCDHEELAAACRRHNRWEFQFLLAPLRLQNATCSPVNPLAVF